MASSSQPSIAATTTLGLPLLTLDSPPQPPRPWWRFSTFIFLCFAVLALVAIQYGRKEYTAVTEERRGIPVGKFGFNWTEEMLSWERTAYHFQPPRNWMNDPNGPLYHMGWYHLFYQYNPNSAAWGNITWGHAISRDLIHWMYLPLAMVPDHEYDLKGVWTGSATILPGRGILILYTGDTYDSVQVQNLAYPANISDPLLLNWVKYPGNPVMVPPPGVGSKYFRDPTTAWLGSDGGWRVAIGSKLGKSGMSLVYRTVEFTRFELLSRPLHVVPGTGMWECVDFYPVSTEREEGVDTSSYGPDLKHVLKVSLDDDKHDYYVMGTYDVKKDVWRPDDGRLDVGRGLRVDYGIYYASKSFYDPKSRRRILYGWSKEGDGESDDLAKGWASIHTIPRTVLFDKKTKKNLLQWPVKEVEGLRHRKKKSFKVMVAPGSVVQLNVTPASQLDITAEFETGEGMFSSSSSSVKSDWNGEGGEGERCGGAWERKRKGPFGIMVLATATLSELTAVYFDIRGGRDETLFCTDVTRSSMAPDVVKEVYGSRVPVLEGEKLRTRILVDHSVVESFGQGGRRCITARVYPTLAISHAANIFLFNNSTSTHLTATVDVWHMRSASIHPFFDHPSSSSSSFFY